MMGTPPALADAIQILDCAVRLKVRVTPKADRDRIDGMMRIADGTAALKARVRAVPENGAANKAVSKLLAKSAGVAKSGVRVVSGPASRLKIVEISGDPKSICSALAPLCTTK
jgi:hypothetical protein